MTVQRTRDEEQHLYLAGHGYVCARVDMRGSGDSEGIQLDEYLPVEQQDGFRSNRLVGCAILVHRFGGYVWPFMGRDY